MPKNPFGQDDPLAPVGGGVGGAWGEAGQGAGGFGATAGRSSAYAADEYDVVDIEAPAASGATAAPAPKGKAAKTQPLRGGDIAAREADLARREAELRRREANMDRMQAGFNPLAIKNWPPCLPIVHHDIPNDIPEGRRNIQRAGFIIFLLTIVALVYNFVCVLVAIIAADTPGDVVGALLLSIIYVLVGVPGAWVLWYNRLYRAMMTDGAVSFATFFIVFLVHIFFAVWSAVAPGIIGADWAHAGFISAIKLLKGGSGGDKLTGVFYIVGAGVWSLLAFLSLTYLARVYAFFRASGGEARARREVTQAGAQMAANEMMNNGGRR